MVNQAEEDATTIPEDTSSQDTTTAASSATPEPETFITLSAWGGNHFGELGNGTTTDSSTPVQVTDPNDPSGYLSGVQAIAAGSFHSLALKNDGTVWAWGGNFAGQLGNGTYTDSSTPVQVGNLDGVKTIAAGLSHSLAVQ
jgi:alpha-tubulin suppressor-like RCC1 family protein